MRSIAFDTETTGTDLRHICRPFFFTLYDGNKIDNWWWRVDPLTRGVKVVKEDLEEMAQRFDDADEIVFQNAKFDIGALDSVGLEWKPEWWDKTQDTLLSAHLLASGEPHDLTTLALRYLRVDIKKFEDALERVCKEARGIVRRKYKDWRIADDEDPGLPSLKSSKKRQKKTETGGAWKWDMWLPCELARAEGWIIGQCTVVNLQKEPFDVRIDRQSKWGNPFVIGRDGTRQEVIAKYERYIRSKPELLNSIKELDEKRLGCHCKPDECHGDVLAKILSERAHPFATALPTYSNADSASTLPIWHEHVRLMEERNLLPIYDKVRRLLIRRIFEMEKRGITCHEDRLDTYIADFTEIATTAEKVCVNLSGEMIDSLPKSGSTKEMRCLLFEEWKIPVIESSEKTGQPSVNQDSMDVWAVTLPANSKPLSFITNLGKNRKHNTAVSFMRSYKRFGVRTEHESVLRLHSSLNPTATAHLRWASSNPNQQNISKQEGANIRYCFGPAPGREWWAIDYENIELRIPAYESGEEEMVNIFERPNDPPYFGSYHLLVFNILHPEKFAKDGIACKDIYKGTWYQWTKNGTFARQYGAVVSSGTADKAYRVPGAQLQIDHRFPKVTALNKHWIRFAAKNGYVLTMEDREVGAYPLQVRRGKGGQVMPTIPFNYHVSGTAMWCMCRAMIRCGDYLDSLTDHFMTMQVHDELVFDFPKGDTPTANLPKALKLKEIMEESGKDIGVPLKASVSYHPHNWAKSEKLAIAA